MEILAHVGAAGLAVWLGVAVGGGAATADRALNIALGCPEGMATVGERDNAPWSGSGWDGHGGIIICSRVISAWLVSGMVLLQPQCIISILGSWIRSQPRRHNTFPGQTRQSKMMKVK